MSRFSGRLILSEPVQCEACNKFIRDVRAELDVSLSKRLVIRGDRLRSKNVTVYIDLECSCGEILTHGDLEGDIE